MTLTRTIRKLKCNTCSDNKLELSCNLKRARRRKPKTKRRKRLTNKKSHWSYTKGVRRGRSSTRSNKGSKRRGAKNSPTRRDRHSDAVERRDQPKGCV